MNAYWRELAFAGLAVGGFLVPEAYYPFLAAATGFAATGTALAADIEKKKKLQERLFGWHIGNTFGMFGENEWTSVKDKSLFLPHKGLHPAPIFNFIGLMELASIFEQRKLVPVSPDDTIETNGNLLLVGGTRVTREIEDVFHDFQNMPFKFVADSPSIAKFNLETPPAEITRHCKYRGDVFTRKSVTGKFLVDMRDPDIPPLGPYVTDMGRIKTDVLSLVVGIDSKGNQVTIANAGYGAAINIKEVFFSGSVLEEMLSKVPLMAPRRIQAVFTVPVEHTDSGEEYGSPQFIDAAAF